MGYEVTEDGRLGTARVAKFFRKERKDVGNSLRSLRILRGFA